MQSSKSSSTLRKANPHRSKDTSASTKNKDIQTSISVAKLLQVKLQNLRIEKELDEKNESYYKTFKELSQKTDHLAEELSREQISLNKSKLHLDTISKANEENILLEQILELLGKTEENLNYLLERAESKQAQVTVTGLKSESAYLINEILHLAAQVNHPMAVKIATLSKEFAETLEVSQTLRRLRQEIEENRKDCENIIEKMKFIDRVRNLIDSGSNGSLK